MRIVLTFPNGPSATGIDQAATARAVAADYPGFSLGYWNPTLPSGKPMAFPNLDPGAWPAAVQAVRAETDAYVEAVDAYAPVPDLIPYIGGPHTGDIPTDPRVLRTMVRRFRGSPAIAVDNLAAQAADSPGMLLAECILSEGFDLIAEANAINPELERLAKKYPGKVRCCAEWWLWPHVVEGASLTWNQRRYTYGGHWAVLGSRPIVLLARSKARDGNREAGFLGANELTNEEWNEKKVELAAFYTDLGYDCWVRPFAPNAKMTAEQVAELRSLNG